MKDEFFFYIYCIIASSNTVFECDVIFVHIISATISFTLNMLPGTSHIHLQLVLIFEREENKHRRNKDVSMKWLVSTEGCQCNFATQAQFLVIVIQQQRLH